MRLSKQICFLLFCVFCLSAGVAKAGVINWDGLTTLEDQDQIQEGDGIPSNENIANISYRLLSDFDGSQLTPFLRFWKTGYGSLTNVVYGSEDVGNPIPPHTGFEVAEIRIEASAGYLLSVNSFDLAAFDVGEPSEVRIFDGDFNLLILEPFVITEVDSDEFTHIVPDYSVADPFASAIVIQWQNAFDVAIDNIDFSTRVVPEPATIVGWMLGLSAMGFIAYRRRRMGRG
ncbi:MAG: PEP-CTERM sorting domain-containing protein [Pirellulaceae bacterium]